MAFDVSKLADIVDTMDRYIAAVRPRPEIRAQLDLGYVCQSKINLGVQ